MTNRGDWIGVGVAIGAAVFAVTQDPVWIAVGVAVGAGLSWTRPRIADLTKKTRSRFSATM